MSDPRAIVPYHDPHDPIIPLGEQLLQYFQNHNPTLADLTRPNMSLPPTNYFQNARFQQPHVHAEHSPAAAAIPALTPATHLSIPPAAGGGTLDMFEDRVLWSFVHGNNSTYNKDNNATTSVGSSNNTSNSPRNNAAAGKAVAGPSGTSIGHHATAEEGSGASSKNAAVILSETLPTYSCNCCQVLRDIVHTNGNHTTKLELHGKLGVISHGILENIYFHGMPRGTGPYEMFDFTKKSLEQVKEFLRQYMEEKRLGQYIMMEDPLTPYYEAISVGIVEDPVNSGDFFDKSSSDGNEVNQMEIQGPAVQSRKSSPWKRPSLAEQRERAAMMTVLEVAAYFHMPIEKASKRLMMCPTVIKKICRRGGVRRWPYRKVKSLDERIRKLRGKMDSSHPEDRAHIQAQILSLQRDANVTCFGVPRVNG